MTDGFDLSQAVNSINSLLFTWFLVVRLLVAGLYFTVLLVFVQFRHFGKLFAALKGSSQGADSSVSSFEAFMTSLAARVGTGNIAGVAIAITVGGPGAIFWMWVVALLGMATSMVECTLAQVFKRRDDQGLFRGGPAYYMERGLGKRWLGLLFAVLFVMAYGLVFCGVQSNSVADAVSEAFSVPNWVTAAVLGVLTLLVVAGGLRRVSRTAQAVVPIMAVAYLAVTVYVLLTNLAAVPEAFATIVRSAFGLQEVVGGGVGYAVAAALRSGINRGLFSNEAGLGSSPNAAATAVVNHPARQGYVQALGVFFDTLVICTATAVMILLSGVFVPGQEVAGVTLTQQALSAEVGSWGTQFVAIVLLFFGFTTIIALYSYAETNLLYVVPGNRRKVTAVWVLRVVVTATVVLGALVQLTAIWTAADFALGITAVINLLALVLLSPLAFAVIKDYGRKLKDDPNPPFDPACHPRVAALVDPDVWPSATVAPAAGHQSSEG